MMSLFTSPTVRNGEIFNLKIMGNYESFYNLDISLVTPTPLQNNISIASEEMCLVYIEIDVCIICQHMYRRISGNMRFFFYDQTWESQQILCFLWPTTLKIYLFYRTLLCKINLWLQISSIWSVLTNAFKIWRHTTTIKISSHKNCWYDRVLLSKSYQILLNLCPAAT